VKSLIQSLSLYSRSRGGRFTPALLVLITLLLGGQARAVVTPLADQPVFSSTSVPGNLLLSLSVEYPTAISVANYASYSSSSTFYGYFDPNKCYTYYYNTSDSAAPYFAPYGPTDASHRCTSTVNVSYVAHYFILSLLYLGSTTPAVDPSTSTQLWSGNYLNWATMQTIDPFRSALTGGYRAVDTSTLTVLEKAYGSAQGGTSNFPDRILSGNTITSTYGASGSSAASCNSTSSTGGSDLAMPSIFPLIAINVYICQRFTVVGVTPFPLSSIDTRIWSQGFGLTFTNANGSDTGFGAGTTAYQPSVYVGNLLPPVILGIPVVNSTEYAAQVRVKVCDATVGIEANCTKYGSNYKPEGLIQSNAQKMRFGAMGYLDDSSTSRDGGVLRAKMKYVGPTMPVPGSTSVTNSAAEWNPSTGIFVANPNAADATATTSLTGVTVTTSGVINYLNNFGNPSLVYKTYDPVSELYYAGLRYFKNQGNVSAYSSSMNATMLDGFPVITAWDDPIQYACQRNYILGVGDIHTNYDANVPGTTLHSANEPALPAELTADTTVNATTATNKVGAMEGSVTGVANAAALGSAWIPNANSGTYYIAGLAYDAHTKDMRPNDFKTSSNLDASGNKIYTQTVSTYWLDVLEYTSYIYQNQFWLAAKYGGFTVPSGFSPYSASTTSLNSALWDPQGTTDSTFPGVVVPRLKPANYYNGGDPQSMISGLTQALSNIVAGAAAGSSQLNTVSAQLSASNNITYSTSYNPADWTGDLVASLTSFDSAGNATSLQQWSAQTNLDAQAAGTGWNTARVIASASGTNTAAPGVPFRYASLSGTQLANLGSGALSRQNMLNYLRGDRSNEGSAGLQLYRSRNHLLGDIADSKAVAVAAPASGYSDSTNPGYSAFATARASRTRMVYAGANDGMLHAFDGQLAASSATAGNERFAYVPSLVLPGPNSTPATDGLAALGNTSFTHHAYVDATPVVFDVDFNKTSAATPATNDWRTLLVGGLGKGGKEFYALDVSNGSSITTETQAASAVMWEFTNATMGYSYGNPIIAKTKKYGWVVILTSGYNNSDGIGRLYIVSPKSGALLETISTGAGSLATPGGLTYATGFVIDYTDYTIDSVYAGDLLGNLWRFDMTPASGSYSAPLKLATLTSSSGSAQPVTTRPLVEVDPTSSKRYVLVGTGRLLDSSDISSSQVQSFYAIVDGTRSAFSTSGSYPIARANLTANTNLLTGIATSVTVGWYYDMTHSSTDSNGNAVTERVNVMPTANSGIVAWAGNVPAGSICSASGTYNVYAVNIETGKSVLTNAAYDSGTGAVTDLNFVNVNGSVRLEAGLDNKSLLNLPGNFSATTKFTPLNWREIPTPD